MTTSVGGPVRLCDLADLEPALAALTEIFFDSSARTIFSGDEDRRRFLERWTRYYLDDCREDIWVWRQPDGAFAGYLTGCRDSVRAGLLYARVPGYALFEDCFAAFPAHLHVNCDRRWRGVGIGAGLVESFVGVCEQAGLAGVHVVTAPDARNVRFYDRVGFTERLTRSHAGRSLLFMGRRLGMRGNAG